MPDRATIANMAPEYGATMGFFPVDERTIEYFQGTGRTKDEIERLEAYFKAQGLFGVPRAGEIDYSAVVTLDLGTVTPSLAGPKRPQDRIEIGKVAPVEPVQRSPRRLQQAGRALRTASLNQPDRGAGMPTRRPRRMPYRPPAERADITIGNGDVLIAAITSCTNTSNPGVLLAAGLLAKKAVRSRAEGQAARQDLAGAGLAHRHRIPHARLGCCRTWSKLGFAVAGYGCTTCIGNSGDLTPEINEAIIKNDLICAAVLSGNRNFEARIHPNIKANFLASPPLVVAYAIAGTVLRDLMTEPVGQGHQRPGRLAGRHLADQRRDLRADEARDEPQGFPGQLRQGQDRARRAVEDIQGVAGQVYDWPSSTYIAEPPFFEGFRMQANDDRGAASASACAARASWRCSATRSPPTTSRRPARSRKLAGRPVAASQHGVSKADFNSYGSRRGNHEVMMRGTFANVRIKNLMIPPGPDGSREEGGVTLISRDGSGARREKMFIYDAAMKYIAQGTPTVIFAGEEYGTGSSRDWAAKGTQLLGIKAVVARSFERIHRSNLVGMGVLPLQFKGGTVVAGARHQRRRAHRHRARPGAAAAKRRQAGGHPAATGAPRSAAHAAHRHADRGRLLPARRHPAVRAAAAARRLIVFT